jgi:hypothetical protein
MPGPAEGLAPITQMSMTNTFRLSLSSNAASQPTEEVFSSALLSKTLAALLVTNSVRNNYTSGLPHTQDSRHIVFFPFKQEQQPTRHVFQALYFFSLKK